MELESLPILDEVWKSTFRKDRFLCDLDPVARHGGGQLPPHLKVLATILGMKFISTFLKKTTVLKLELQESAVSELLEFVYTGKCLMNKGNRENLMDLATEF